MYYIWRRNSIFFKKYSIFSNCKTLNNKEYLKDYAYTFLFNDRGNNKFLHEHAIFCSDYFIKKLRKSQQ